MRARQRNPKRSARAARRAVLLLLAVTLSWAFPYFEGTRNANEIPRLLQALALVDEADWHVDGLSARGIDPGPDVARTSDDRLAPNKPPGATVAAVAGLLAGRAWADEVDKGPLTLRAFTWWARLFGALLPTLLLCSVLLRRWWSAMGLRPLAAAVILYGLGTPAAAYAHLLYGHQLAALAIFGGCFLLADAREGGRADLALFGGALLGSAVLVEYGSVFAALPVGIMLLAGVMRPRGLGVLSAALGGALVPMVLLGAYHTVVFGSPWTTGYHRVVDPAFAALHGQGLLGLGWPTWSNFHTHWLAMDAGLLWWAPLVVPGIAGLVLVAAGPSSHRVEARLLLGLLVTYAVVSCGLSFTGGWRIGPRYMVAVLPALVLGWAELGRRWGRANGWVLLFVGFGTYQLVVNGLAAHLWPHVDVQPVHQPVSEILLPLLGRGLEPYGVPYWIGWAGPQGWSATALCAIGLALLSFVVVAIPTRSNVPAAATAVVMGLLLVAVTQALPRHPLGSKNLAYIVGVWEPKAAPGVSRTIGPMAKYVPTRATGPVEVIPEAPRRRGASSPAGSGR